jgi:hypothetical protein
LTITVLARDFRERWLAESVRRQEAEHGPVPDVEAVRFARGGGGDLEQRIIARARRLPGAERFAAQQERFLRQLRGSWLVLLLVAAVLGFGVSLAIAGEPSTPINVFWAAAAFLGPQLLSLALWAAGMMQSSASRGGVFGWAWSRAALRWLPRGDAAQVAHAFYGLHEQRRLVRWWLGAVMHSAWSLAFIGMLLGLVMALSLRSYGFVLETTILPEAVLRRFVAALGWLPALFGFSQPEESAIRAALDGDAWNEAARQAWAWWFMGLLIIYGLVPRLLLWGLCSAQLARGRRALRLELALPGYARLREVLLPGSDEPDVTDPPAPLPPRIVPRPRRARASGEPVAVALEPDGDPWPAPLPAGVHDAGRLDNRAEREAARELLEARGPRRLLIACNTALTPDRGSLRLIDTLAAQAGEAAAWLAPLGASGSAGYQAAWQRALASRDFAAEEIFTDFSEALAWLKVV